MQRGAGRSWRWPIEWQSCPCFRFRRHTASAAAERHRCQSCVGTILKIGPGLIRQMRSKHWRPPSAFRLRRLNARRKTLRLTV
jgi:hypothetical protein